MPVILSNSQVNDLCQLLVNESAAYSLAIAPLLDTMFLTGLRINEVYQLERWDVTDPSTPIVRLEKASGTRAIDAALLHPHLHDMLLSSPLPIWPFSVRQVNYFIRASQGYAKLTVKSKEVASHLFRYNYCRQLYEQGMTITQIKDAIVHSSVNVTAGYILNDITAFDSR